MKKIFFSTLCSFMIFSASGQNTIDLFSRTNVDLHRNNRLESKYEKAVGTPYTNDKFSLASINNVASPVLVRYNAEADEIEVENKESEKKYFTLPKDKEYNQIAFKNGTYKFVLVNYKDVKGAEVNGYLIEKFVKNDVTLFKKEKVNYIKGKEAENSYTMSSPAKLVRAKDEFYIQLKNKEIVEFPKNKKKFIAMFESKKDAINTYLKENDISFSEENDMAKVTEFISTL